MRMIQGRYRYAQATELYEYLGVKRGQLPREGMPERLIQGVRVYVKPLITEAHRAICLHCELEIEGFPPSRDWRDRGNNRTCNDGKHNHKPRYLPRRNFQGLRVMAICDDCGRHVAVGRMHQHKCKG